MNKALPQVVLVGRINAGKSTLFNTLSETGQAIVSPIPGTTRDLNYAKINWREHQFTLIDTGGLDAGQLGQIEGFVQKKAFQAIEKADLIVHIIDGHLELTSEDRKISKQFKKDNKKTILVINKVDGYKLRTNVSPDFYKLGYKKTMLISAINGVGTGDLLDEIINFLPVKKTTEKKNRLKAINYR